MKWRKDQIFTFSIFSAALELFKHSSVYHIEAFNRAGDKPRDTFYHFLRFCCAPRCVSKNASILGRKLRSSLFLISVSSTFEDTFSKFTLSRLNDNFRRRIPFGTLTCDNEIAINRQSQRALAVVHFARGEHVESVHGGGGEGIRKKKRAGELKDKQRACDACRARAWSLLPRVYAAPLFLALSRPPSPAPAPRDPCDKLWWWVSSACISDRVRQCSCNETLVGREAFKEPVKKGGVGFSGCWRGIGWIEVMRVLWGVRDSSFWRWVWVL